MCSADIVWFAGNVSVVPSAWCRTTCTVLPGARPVGQRLDGAVARVDAEAGFAARERVDRAEEQVLRDVREMPAVREPLPGRRDVIGRALALGLQQHAQVVDVATVPGREGRQQ